MAVLIAYQLSLDSNLVLRLLIKVFYQVKDESPYSGVTSFAVQQAAAGKWLLRTARFAVGRPGFRSLSVFQNALNWHPQIFCMVLSPRSIIVVVVIRLF